MVLTTDAIGRLETKEMSVTSRTSGRETGFAGYAGCEKAEKRQLQERSGLAQGRRVALGQGVLRRETNSSRPGGTLEARCAVPRRVMDGFVYWFIDFLFG